MMADQAHKRKRKKRIWRNSAIIFSFFLILTTSTLPEVKADATTSASSSIQFTASEYAVTIPENSMGKVYARPTHSGLRMGLHMGLNNTANVRFKIRSGDPEGFFKAEAEKVGDFVFLVLRTRTNNNNVLNRERVPEYRLEVRARIRGRATTSKQHPKCVVKVVIEDVNDNDPLFVRDRWKFEVGEDAALHTAVGRVHADDADEGVNGQVYYGLLDAGDDVPFAVDPASGVISVTRPLSSRERAKYQLTVIARDRGFKPQGELSPRVSSAAVIVKVVQVGGGKKVTQI